MRRGGFTLVELLVVISVIAVLMAVLVPVIRAAREQSRSVVCASNLKHLGLALLAYEQQTGTFPYGFSSWFLPTTPGSGPYPGSAIHDDWGWWWFQSIRVIDEGEFGKGSILWCPARSVQDTRLRPNILCGNYGVNRAICLDAPVFVPGEFIGKPLGLYQVRRPGETLLVADSGYSLISWRAAADSPIQRFENSAREGSFYVPGLSINTERRIFRGQEDDAIYGRHPRKTVNAAFADGHAGRFKAEALLVEPGSDGYTNTFPLWLPAKR